MGCFSLFSISTENSGHKSTALVTCKLHVKIFLWWWRIDDKKEKTFSLYFLNKKMLQNIIYAPLLGFCHLTLTLTLMAFKYLVWSRGHLQLKYIFSRSNFVKDIRFTLLVWKHLDVVRVGIYLRITMYMKNGKRKKKKSKPSHEGETYCKAFLTQKAQAHDRTLTLLPWYIVQWIST